jgi:hypothetical protein
VGHLISPVCAGKDVISLSYFKPSFQQFGQPLYRNMKVFKDSSIALHAVVYTLIYTLQLMELHR